MPHLHAANRTLRAALLGTAVATLALQSACGERGQPKPPEPVVRAPGAGSGGGAAITPGGGAAQAGLGTGAPGTGAPGAGAPGAGASRPVNTPGTAAGYKVSTSQSDPRLIEVGGLVMMKPSSWVWTAPTMQFRALQYSVPAVGTEAPAAELVFSVFVAGDGGPVDANLDRWAGQFRGPDGQAAPAKRSKSTQGEFTISRIESVGSYMGMGQAAPRPDQMQLGAIIEASGRNVFAKLVGSTATVESNRAAFEAMLASMKNADSAAAPSDGAAAPSDKPETPTK